MNRYLFKLAFLYPRIYSFIAYHREKKRKKEYEDNVKLFYDRDSNPREYRRIIRGMFELRGTRRMQRYLIPYFDARFIEQFVEIEGREILDRALAEGRGVVLLSAHLGNLNFGLSIIRKLGYNASFLKAGSPEKRRSRNALHVNPPKYSIYISKPPVSDSTKERIRETLQSGKIVYYTVDSAWGRRKAIVPFCGRKIGIPTGMIYFARSANATIIPFFQLYRHGNIKLIFKEPIDGRWKQGERDYDRVIEEFARILESYVSTYPNEYYGNVRFMVS